MRMRDTRCALALVLGSVGACASPNSQAAARAQPPLALTAVITPADDASPPSQLPPLPPGADKQRLVRLRRDLLRSGTGDPAADVILNLFDDVGPLRVRPKAIQQTPNGRVWSGDLVERNGHVILTDGPAGVYGVVRVVGYGEIVLRTFRDDLLVAAYSPVRQPIACALTNPVAAPVLANRVETDSRTPVTIDVLTLVSPQAVCGEGGCTAANRATKRCQLQGEMNVWFYDTNYSLQQSQVNAQLQWIGYQEFDPGERNDLGAMVTELINPSTAKGAAVLTARNTASADIVAVVVNQGTDHGAAQPLDPTQTLPTLGNHALAVVKRWNALPEFIFSHEVGHTLGAGHEDGQYGYSSSSRAWANGSVEHTIMATGSGNTWSYYSNKVVPNPNAPGTTIGDATRDNAGTINGVRQAASAWKPAASAAFAICQP
jgi:Metallo-peptidase family M12